MDDLDQAARWKVDRIWSSRPHLQLVQPVVELGPISPELVLVCPELAPAARAALPNPPWSSPTRGDGSTRSGERPARAPAGDSGTVPFDTPDRRLKHHGICLEHRRSESSSSWRLVLPRGEVVEREGAPGDECPPAEIAALLSAIAGDESLLPVLWYGDDEDVARLQSQIAEQGQAMLRHDPGTRLGTDPENLHQFRVASRRLRAFLRVGRSVIDRDWSLSVRTELGELARKGGPVRDLDVLLEQLEQELETLDADESAAADRLVAALASDRDRLQQELLAALDEPAYLSLVGRLAQPIQLVAQPTPLSLRKRSRRELERLVDQVQRLGSSPADEALHALRIRVKRVRYAVELAGAERRPRTERVIAAAKALQDVLGEHQDTVVAEQLLAAQADLSSDTALAFVAGRLAERQRYRRQQLHERLPAAWKRLRRAARKLR